MPAVILPLSGVFVDGSAPVSHVPSPQSVHVAKGSTTSLKVTVVNSAGTAVDLSNATGKLSIQQYTDDPAPLLQVTGTLDSPATDGVVTFALTPANTNGLGLGSFVFDVEITFSDTDVVQVVPASPFIIDPAF